MCGVPMQKSRGIITLINHGVTTWTTVCCYFSLCLGLCAFIITAGDGGRPTEVYNRYSHCFLKGTYAVLENKIQTKNFDINNIIKAKTKRKIRSPEHYWQLER